jgi:membrane protein required for colicin V production
MGTPAVTQFDYAVIAILAFSALVGFWRGAAREIVTVLAFVLAALSALFGLRYVAPIGRAGIDPDWAGEVVAAVAVFLVVYIVLRLMGAALARRVKDSQVMGPLDRSIGLGFGLVRAVVFLGALNLLFHAATPSDRIPPWISQATLYPMTTAAGRALAAVAPKGLAMARRAKPAVDEVVKDSAGDRRQPQGYDARERHTIDILVEKAR